MATEETMPQHEPSTPREQYFSSLSGEERRSLTHSEFWIPEEEREIYKQALDALNEAGIRYVVTGAYAIYEYAGIYRDTKDLDLFTEPRQVVPAMRVLRQAGFTTRLEQPHWLAKGKVGELFVDLIFGMGNGLALVDEDWYQHSRPSILAARQVRVAPPEELIWHRLFINERHRHDMADIVHLILCTGHRLDWARLVRKTGEHWPLLLAQLQMFAYIYPQVTGRVPSWVLEELLGRAAVEVSRTRSDEPVTRGTLVSRFSFAIDVNEWGMRDLREEAIRATEREPMIREIAASDVWDERSEMVEDYRRRVGDSA
jgi:hypothetical protein